MLKIAENGIMGLSWRRPLLLRVRLSALLRWGLRLLKLLGLHMVLQLRLGRRLRLGLRWGMGQR